MRIEGSVGHAMHQLDDIPIFDDVDGLVHGKVLSFWPFDDPPIIDILKSNRVLLSKWLKWNKMSNETLSCIFIGKNLTL